MKPEDFNDIVTFKDFYAYIDSNIKKKEVI
jgi:hypothetical protein